MCASIYIMVNVNEWKRTIRMGQFSSKQNTYNQQVDEMWEQNGTQTECQWKRWE